MRPATSISPDTGRSRPAIERNVVVLPQPEGPSSVNNFPSGTSNETFCAALTTVPRSLAYSVKSDLTLSTFDVFQRAPPPSCPASCRAPTTFFPRERRGWPGQSPDQVRG